MSTRICGVEGCDRVHRSNGYCYLHNRRLRRTGDPLGTRRPTAGMTDRERFMSAVRVEGSCWVWTRGTRAGYGRFWYENAERLAHRWSIEHLGGVALSPTDVVMHSCDNPPCVNPEHLSVGTHRLNAIAAVERGLAPLGERHGMHRLTEAQVRTIRTSTRTERDLARQFGVAQHTVHAARVRKTWKHVA